MDSYGSSEARSPLFSSSSVLLPILSSSFPRPSACPSNRASLGDVSSPSAPLFWGLAKLDASNYRLLEIFLANCFTWLKAHNCPALIRLPLLPLLLRVLYPRSIHCPGQEVEGIFRKAGSESRLAELQKQCAHSGPLIPLLLLSSPF